MIIKLHESKLFTVDTAVRFSREYGCSPKLWNDIWSKYLNGYDEYVLAGYFMYKTNKRIRASVIKRWLVMTEIYCRANHVMLMGVRVVQSEYFGQYEAAVLKEVLRNMKSSIKSDSRIIL
jgi:hypothetical protein